jgi:hypothetical protein
MERDDQRMTDWGRMFDKSDQSGMDLKYLEEKVPGKDKIYRESASGECSP